MIEIQRKGFSLSESISSFFLDCWKVGEIERFTLFLLTLINLAHNLLHRRFSGKMISKVYDNFGQSVWFGVFLGLQGVWYLNDFNRKPFFLSPPG